MDTVEVLERLHERHFHALESVGSNQGIKAYALEARVDIMALIKKHLKLLEAVREIERRSRYFEVDGDNEGDFCSWCTTKVPDHHQDCIFTVLDGD